MSGKWSDTNGCGPSKAITIFGYELKPPYHIFFDASCCKHDRLYGQGGTEEDRALADWLFLFYIKRDVARTDWYKRPHLYVWTYIYYYGVRVGGKSSFNYHTLIQED